MATSVIPKWLDTKAQPSNLYELLGHPCFDPRHEDLLETVRSAYAELLPYQNHADAAVARRAMQLQMELGRAEATLGDPDKLRAHDAAVIGRLRESYAAACGGEPPPWDAARVRQWLQQQHCVHCDRLDWAERTIVAAATETGKNRPLDTREVRAATAAHALPEPGESAGGVPISTAEISSTVSGELPPGASAKSKPRAAHGPRALPVAKPARGPSPAPKQGESSSLRLSQAEERRRTEELLAEALSTAATVRSASPPAEGMPAPKRSAAARDPIAGRRKAIRWVAGAVAAVTVVGVLGLCLAPRSSAPPLRLEPIAAQSVEVGNQLRLHVPLVDAVRWKNQVYFCLADGAPAGGSIDPPTGDFTWKPQTPGTYQFTVRVVSLVEQQCKDEASFSVEVRTPPPPVRRAPKLAALADCVVREGEELRVQLALVDRGTAGDNLRYSLVPGAPEGVAIDAASGALTWRPRAAGAFSMRVRVAGADDLADETGLRVAVQHVCQPPRIQALPPQDITAGKTSTIPVFASDPDTPAEKLRFALVGAPPGWVSIDPVTGILTCAPPQDLAQQDSIVSIRVTDDSPTPLTDEKTLLIRVTPPQPPAVAMDGGVALPSGKLISDGEFETLQAAKQDAQAIHEACVAGDLTAVAIWSDRAHTAISAYAWVRGEVPKGRAVFFYPGKDPLTCYQNALHRGGLSSRPVTPSPLRYPSGARITFPRPRIASPNVQFWDDVAVKFRVDYDNGKCRHLAAWDEQGAKKLFCSYNRGRRNGLCCYFQEDRLRLVLECNAGNIAAVHLISAGKTQQTFTDLQAARGDVAARALLDAIDTTETDLAGASRQLAQGARAVVLARAGEQNVKKRAAISAGIRAHQQLNDQNMQGLIRHAFGN